MVSGLPRTVVVSSAEIRQASRNRCTAIVDAVRATLDQTPPELAGDIMDRGIVLTGGGALLRGLDDGSGRDRDAGARGRRPADLRGPRRRAGASRSSRPSSRCWSGAAVLMGRRQAPEALGQTIREEVAQRPSRRGTRSAAAGDGLGRLLVVLVLACATIITLDYRGGSDSPLEPARKRSGGGPRPGRGGRRPTPYVRSLAIPDLDHSKDSLRKEITDRKAENSELRQQVETSDLDRNRLAEYDGLAHAAADTRPLRWCRPTSLRSVPASRSHGP